MIARTLLRAWWTAALWWPTTPLAAQMSPDTLPGRARLSPLVTVGSEAEERTRLSQLLGRTALDGFLIRSPSTLTPALPGAKTRFRWAALDPQLDFTWNSQLPFSLNDGPLWAGRGRNFQILAGARATVGPLSVIIAPQMLFSQNRGFVAPDPRRVHSIPPGRSPFSSPWHTIPYSADLPLDFGQGPFARFDPGQSSLTLVTPRVSFGLSTENQWWGPGIRNAIVMSNNAPGIPQLFVRSTRPWTTGAGAFEARWMVGGLSESRYFDADPTNDLRSISALAATWRPKWVPRLTVGLARAVYAPARRWTDLPLRLFNVLGGTGRPNSLPASDSSLTPGRDQIYSVFARWVLPDDGFEAYAEWSHTEFPASLRDLLTAPGHSQGYTLGLQWAKSVARGAAVLRLQGETTYLERNSSFRDRPEGIYYTSRAVVQGYTQHGQIVGAAIGPGASSQWLAIDFVPARWRVGVVGGRIRWEDDVLYTLGIAPGYGWCSHDVSLFGGVRAGYTGPRGVLSVALFRGTRYNVFFRHFAPCGGEDDPKTRTDVPNTTLELRLSPSW